MKILFLVNDPAELEPIQTTTMLIEEAVRRGYEVDVAGVEHLWLDADDGPTSRACHVTAAPADRVALVESLAATEPTRCALADCELIWIRTNPARDPGRALAHEVMPALMRLAQREGCRVVSDPAGLERASTKLYLHHVPPRFRPRTMIGRDPEALLAFVRDLEGPCVLKPLRGTHGRDVFRIAAPGADNVRQIMELLGRHGHVIAQEFIPEAVDGDVRLILIEGELLEVDGQPAALRRIPGEGDFRSNIHAGGQAAPAELTDPMREMIASVGPLLAEDGIFMAGVDFIGGVLVEINVFSPGGLRDCHRFYGADFTGEVVRRAVASG